MAELLQMQMVFQRSIERALDNFKKLGRSNITAAKTRNRLAMLEKNWTQYQTGHAQLLTAIPAKDRPSMDYFGGNYFEATEDVYQTTSDHLTDCLESLEPVVSQNQSVDQNRVLADASSIAQSHMPKINLPPFAGDFAEWESFRDRFSALIIENQSLTDFARMHYLASSLKDRALDSISSITMTANNFELAWSTLTARFENKRRLIASHFSKLLGGSVVSKESASELQLLCDTYNISVSSLRKLGRTPSDLWDDFLVHSLTQKLDSVTRKAWNLKTSDCESPTQYEDLMRFLAARIRALEECAFNSAGKPKTVTASRVHVANTATSASASCPLCKSRHYLSVCQKFTTRSPTQRRQTVKQLKRCFNCLSASHTSTDCRSKYSCRSCGKRHHSMLHTESEAGVDIHTPIQDVPAVEHVATNVEVNSHLASANERSRSQVLLATARVKISTETGRCAVVRALLDQGSEVTFVSEALSQSLRAKRIRMPVSISAVGGNQIGAVRHAAAITISPSTSGTPSLTTTALILPTLTSYAPKRVADLSVVAHLSNLKWADSDPTSSDPIHVIIGADLYGSIIQKGIRTGGSDQPIAQNTIFGWIISGPVGSEPPQRPTSLTITAHHCTSLNELSKDIQRFWATEELPHQVILSKQEEQCETHFRETHSRTSSGQYTVRLPFNVTPPPDIGQSRQIAERQLNSLVRRLASQPDIQSEYNSFMAEYEQLGHMQRVPDSFKSATPIVYIPHHPILRADSSTTRLRVVFNASNRASSGTSLNDHLLAGPKLQTELPATILHWRQHRFVYTADIAKMYRQILVDARDRDYQRILWQPPYSKIPLEYQLLTVTYGMTCAPFLALRVLQQLASDEGTRFPLAVPILRHHIYVDDVLFGSHDITSLKRTRDQLILLLRSGNFELRKWASNSATLLEDLDPANHGLACSKAIASDEKVKILGIFWNPARDKFHFLVNLTSSCPRSKRAILSTIARLYDPLGWVTPVTVSTKILMQRLWRSKVSWDEDIPEHLFSQWQTMYSQLGALNKLKLDRWTGNQPDARLELHGFADASTLAYAAAVYLRVISSSGDVTISLLAGKSRVAPLAPLTVPRLELSAALLLSRLTSFVRTHLDKGTIPCFCWTDSTIVLTWIRAHPSRWNTFVANRVLAIQTTLPDAVWRHVPTTSNPADCASRGLHGDDLLQHPLWWKGPPWLRSPPEVWPQTPVSCHDDPLEERKAASHHVAKAISTWDLSEKFSSWVKLVRVTAYVLRFINACRRPRIHDPGGSEGATISSADFNAAKTFWLKHIQTSQFSEEINALRSGHPVSSKSKLSALTPFLDDQGLLRVGGRLGKAPLPYQVRHPLILASHALVRLIAAHAHVRTLHGGLQLTLNTLRQEYWILRARSLVRTIIHQCLTCVRERASVPTQLMGDLPAVRVSKPPRSFSHCGVDYAGPFKVRPSSGRGITSRKSYVALFVCLATRAIHLELVSDYSTAAFLAAFTRFCSRRGLPQSVYSDHGTNFVGADRELTAAYRTALRDADVQAKIASENISWHFIPPSAPHFGGLWEAGVRSVKHHLRRVLGDHTLTFEEFNTLLCRIEACLNSRPIAPLSDSIDDFRTLTPGHFLIGSNIITPPEPSTLHLQENRLSRWQLVHNLTERFWQIWTTDYINTLQQRAKWRQVSPPIRIGNIVLLRNPSLPPCKWELGRVIKIHPGSDGLTRVVSVKTAHSEYTRPIGKLCVLPIANASPSNEDM